MSHGAEGPPGAQRAALGAARQDGVASEASGTSNSIILTRGRRRTTIVVKIMIRVVISNNGKNIID